MLAILAKAQLAAAPWPKFHGSTTNSGISTASGATNVLKWSYKSGAAISSSPAIGPDGTVYVGSSDFNVYALNGATGAVNWSYATSGAVVSSPAVSQDGAVYVGSMDGNVYALSSASGNMLWSFSVGSPIESSPTIGADGTIYIGADNGSMFALNGKTGVPAWSFSTGGHILGSPAIGADGSVYFGSQDGNVYSLNSSLGTETWIFHTGAPVESSPAIGLNGNVYIGSDDGNVYALNGSTGALVWSQAVYAQFVNSSPAIGVDGTVYVGANSNIGYFYALDGATGAVKWNFTSGQYIDSSPAIGADGTIYVGGTSGSQNGVVYALNGLTGVQEWAFGTGDSSGIFSSPAIGGDGTIYFGSNDGSLYALVGVHVQSLGISPSEISGGVSATGTVTLSAPAPEGGVTVILTSNSNLVTMPQSLAIPEGKSIGTFPVATSGVSLPTTVVITAGFGITLSANLTIDPASLLSLSLDPPSVTGGTSSTGTVTLSAPAGPGGVVVQVSSDSTVASVTGPITVPEGQSSASFPITTNVVATAAAADITVAVGEDSITATLAVFPATISSITLSPPTVIGGGSSTGTLTLTGVSALGGTVIELSTDTPEATVPASVTVPAGQSTVTFTVSTTSVSVQTPAVITGSINGLWQTATLTITPNVATGISVSPSSVFGGKSAVGTISISGPAGPSGALINLSSSSSVATVPPTVTIPAGQSTATFVIGTTAVNSQSVAGITGSLNGVTVSTNLMVTPAAILGVSITPNYVAEGGSCMGLVALSSPAGNNGIVVNLVSNSPAASVPSSIAIPAGQSSATFTVNSRTVPKKSVATISATLGNTTQTATVLVMPLGVYSVSISPSAVAGGTSVSGMVTLDGLAPRGGKTVLLTSNTTLVGVPSTLFIAEGQMTGSFMATTAAVSSQKVASITAGLGATNASALLTVNPPELLSISLKPSTVVGGKLAFGTVTLTGPAPAKGISLLVSSNITAAKTPASIIVYGGHTKASFTIETSPVPIVEQAGITASGNGFEVTAPLTITPPAVVSITLSPSSVAGGRNSTGTVRIGGNATAGGVAVSLSSSSPVASLPTTVIVPAGQTSTTFTITTTKPSSKSAVDISATVGPSSKSAVLTVN